MHAQLSGANATVVAIGTASSRPAGGARSLSMPPVTVL
jgi:hypothetical protein